MHTRFATSALVLLAVAASGCYRWTTPAPPSPTAAEARLGQVRVTLTDGWQLLLYKARVQRDSLVGDTLAGALLAPGVHAPPLAIPLANIRSLSSRQFSAGRTALLAVSVPVVSVGIAALGDLLGWWKWGLGPSGPLFGQ